MKLTLERAPLLAALARADRVVERRNTIPILANLRLDAAAGALRIVATDLDIQIAQSLPAEVSAPGSTTAPAHTLYEIARKFPDGAQVQLETSGDRGTLTVRAGRSRFALQTLPESEFPDLAGVEGGHVITLPGKDLAAAIGQVEFAISTEEARYYLNGIYLHPREGKLGLVATDGHRLSLLSLALELPEGLPGVILPRKAVGEVKRLAEAADKADITLEISTHKLAAEFAGARLTTKLIDGTFPDYGRVIPTGNAKVATLEAADLLAAVARVGTIASERGRAVKFTFTSGRLVLAVTNPDAGEASEEIDCVYGAEDLEIGFNGKYVEEALTRTASTGPIEIALNDAGSPALIRRPPADTPTPDALCVLMPMRV
ncbi:MAG: DNA polymerase III subunit beta [Ancylobacter novellus]|uniref:Beta sliding clamp n=1 Tax=Ancylobacter novellus TaxID=921 RepID=A0A2W5QZM7_ANCNO|nr:MAG: DNA polymerase III subunit beta [Ancylobacter novellus]